jgi:raffinose/stachyose/melibiose transport system permease protein
MKKLPVKVFLWFYALISVYPLVCMLFYSFKNNDEIFLLNPFGFPARFRVENYITAWTSYNVPRYFFNSLFVSAVTVFFVLLLSSMFAYGVCRLVWRFRAAARIYVIAGMFVPVQVILLPLAVLMRDIKLANTYMALIVPYIAFNLSFSSMVFYGFLRTIPVEIEESGYLDGAGVYRIFFTLILPVLRPAVATMVIFVFLSSWNEFTMALILVSKEKLKTLPLGLLFFSGEFTTNWGAMGAAMTIASVPTILIYLLFSDQVEKALTVGSAVKG